MWSGSAFENIPNVRDVACKCQNDDEDADERSVFHAGLGRHFPSSIDGCESWTRLEPLSKSTVPNSTRSWAGFSTRSWRRHGNGAEGSLARIGGEDGRMKVEYPSVMRDNGGVFSSMVLSYASKLGAFKGLCMVLLVSLTLHANLCFADTLSDSGHSDQSSVVACQEHSGKGCFEEIPASSAPAPLLSRENPFPHFLALYPWIGQVCLALDGCACFTALEGHSFTPDPNARALATVVLQR